MSLFYSNNFRFCAVKKDHKNMQCSVISRFVFFFLPIVLRKLFTIPLLIKNTRLIQAIGIPTVVSMKLVYEQRETPLLTPDRTSKILTAFRILSN